MAEKGKRRLGSRSYRVGERHPRSETGRDRKKLEDQLTLIEKERGIQSHYTRKKVGKQDKQDRAADTRGVKKIGDN